VPILIAVLLGLSGLLIVMYPLLGLDREPSDALANSPFADDAERERSARDALREVEFDHRLGNLDDADYTSLRARYERRALAALKERYQREQELDALIEQQLDALRLQESVVATAAGEPSPPAPTLQSTETQASRDRHTVTHTGGRPASGPQARRRRGGRQ
jgi:cytochrome c-type biogenesis protein CcmI